MDPGTTCVSFNALAHGYTKFSTEHHSGPGAPPRSLESEAQRLQRYAKNQNVLGALRPDYLLTQEEDFDGPALPGFQYCASVALFDRTEGCVIRSRVNPILHSVGVDLGEGKTAVVAFLRSGLTLISAHLKGGPGSDPVKVAQVRRILTFVPPVGPAIFGGDFNSTNPEEVLGGVLGPAGFTHVPNEHPTGLTSDLSTPLILDHFFIRGDFTAVAAPVIQTPASPWLPGAVVGSDHVPLLITLGPTSPPAPSPSAPRSPEDDSDSDGDGRLPLGAQPDVCVA
jgi:hypothetical protein